ncbi:methyltransferase [Polyangium sp. y55x31]|uniref:methyltransferase n=1 Tax=Polyangium sp. y55x31 TaxID=3042688 RepID=UPI0024824D44|nr:methyltransferase [Polyangium sp. y55x31]MDI1480799.1 methyltransferase [Polyangium sp. y55x31]
MEAASRFVSESLARALALVVPALDILRERPDSKDPPAFCEARGFSAFLRALSDDELARCEAEGLAARLPMLAGAPPSLVELGRSALEVSALPARLAATPGTRLDRPRSISERKTRQLEALLDAVEPMARKARRIVDVGAGRGHFTRLAAEMFDRDAVGIEREPRRVEAASILGQGTRARFVVLDALRDPILLSPDDLAVGLHACGSLGDRLVLEASRAPCDVALVSCCLQKIDRPAREPLSAAARAAGLVLPREALGLSNLTTRLVGVEASLAEMLSGRENRHALARLLRARGVSIAPGEEMRGINRRRAREGLAELSARALALRGLAPATEAEIREHEAEGAIEFGRIRRWTLPRAMLARPLEIAVVLDRAAALEERGYTARVAEVFDADATPRNLAILGEAPRR